MDVSFVSAPLDTGDVHAEAAGRTTTITASGARILMAVVHARTKDVLIAASSMVVSGSGDDQGALLVRLVRRTVDRLDGR